MPYMFSYESGIEVPAARVLFLEWKMQAMREFNPLLQPMTDASGVSRNRFFVDDSTMVRLSLWANLAADGVAPILLETYDFPLSLENELLANHEIITSLDEEAQNKLVDRMRKVYRSNVMLENHNRLLNNKQASLTDPASVMASDENLDDELKMLRREISKTTKRMAKSRARVEEFVESCSTELTKLLSIPEFRSEAPKFWTDAVAEFYSSSVASSQNKRGE